MNTINPFLEYLIHIPFRDNEYIISILLAVALGFISFFVIGTLWGRCWNRKWKLSNHPRTLSIVLLLSLCVVVSGLFYYGSIGCHFSPSVINNEVSNLEIEFTKQLEKICKDENGVIRSKALVNLEKNPAAKSYRIDGIEKTIDMDESDTANPDAISDFVKILAEEMMNVADQQLESKLSSAIPSLNFLIKDSFNSAQTNNGKYINELSELFKNKNLVELKLPIHMSDSDNLEDIHQVIFENFKKASNDNYKIVCIAKNIARQDASKTSLFLFGTFFISLLLIVAYNAHLDIKSTYKD